MSSSPPLSPNTRWDRLQDLFSEALELPESEREAFVLSKAANEPDLAQEVLALLACDTGKSTGPLTHALGAAIDATTRDRRRALVGSVIGNYKLVSVLGHGGTGTVYLGERADLQYSAQVAVKIVDSAAVHPDLGMRFRAERQILANLNHSNIARLVDAGETPDGRPYLVMEYIHGEPIDRYCDAHQLSVNERLGIFLKVCSAVQYAHQNLIVHRDLKPANVMVTSEGAPKLLDFGIAKLLDAGNAGALLALTRMSDRLLTPEYASPEQILGRQVTTVSDVYALGIVLFELLTGLRPYVVSSDASQLELERTICVTDPLKPSFAVKRAIESGPEEGKSDINAVAAARGVTAERLAKQLIGDLDSIVLRAMRKEPEHRYASVEQLMSDVRHYLAREPVLARQGNWVYYSQRFIRRHTFGVAAAATLVLFLTAFTSITLIQNRLITEERDRATIEGERAEKVSRFMQDVFANSDPYETKGQPATTQQLLDRAGQRIRVDLNQAPEVRARLLEAIGRAYRRQAQPDKAVVYLEDALRILKSLNPSQEVETASVLTEIAIAQKARGKLPEAERAFEEAINLSQNGAAHSDDRFARLLIDLGRFEMARANVDDAQRYLQQGEAVLRKLRGPRDPEVAAALAEISTTWSWKDNLPMAEKYIREANDINESTLDILHPDRVEVGYMLGEILIQEHNFDAAEPIIRRTLEAQRVLFGEDSQRVADGRESLASIKLAQDNPRAAEPLAREAVATAERALGKDHYYIGYYYTSLARVLVRLGKNEEAEEKLHHALDLYAKSLPPDHPYIAAAEQQLGEAQLARGNLADAEATLTAAMNRWQRTNQPSWREARSESSLGEVMFKQKRYADAERYLVRSFRVLVGEKNGADPDEKKKAQQRVVAFYTARKEPEKLAELLQEVTPTQEKAVPRGTQASR